MGQRRDAQGHFVQGTQPGPGRPRRQVEREYLVALSEAVTLEDWKVIVERAVMDAKRGDGAARSWLSSYLIGRPGDAEKTIEAAVIEQQAVDELDKTDHDAAQKVVRQVAQRAVRIVEERRRKAASEDPPLGMAAD